MTSIGDLAVIVRSKNAGIAHVTVDAIFDDPDAYRRARTTLDRDTVAAAYGVPADRITDLVHFDEGLAVKVTFRRGQIAGGIGLGETDVYGSGQYAPLAAIPIKT